MKKYIIGTSIDFIQGITLKEAVDMVKNSGFESIEIVPAEYQARTGFPAGKTPGPWARDFPKKDRVTIKNRLSAFKIVTVHGQHIELNIASANPGIKGESQRQYIENIFFANDIGSKIVTFHTGQQTRSSNERKEVIRDCIEFGKKMAEYAEKYDMYIGYENEPRGLNYEELIETISRINSPRFGLNLDVGHTVLMEGSFDYEKTTEISTIKWIKAFKDKIFEVHISGVYRTIITQGLNDHFPLCMDNMQNFPLIIETLKDIKYNGPLILEIMAKDVNKWLKDCISSKEIIEKIL